MLYRLDATPCEEVELLLFRGVRNAPAVRKLVVSGGLEAAALNASLVRCVPPHPLPCAATKRP